MDSDLRELLERSAERAKKKVIGFTAIDNDAHARACIRVVENFGGNPNGFIYINAVDARDSHRPPDILICDNDVGAFMIEVKGYTANGIHEYEAGTFILKGLERQCNPWDQSMKCLQHVSKKYINNFGKTDRPLFSYMVCFPDMTESEFEDSFGAPVDSTLFKDDVADHKRFASKIMKRVQEGMNASGYTKPLSEKALNNMRELFGNKRLSVINKKREQRDIPAESMGVIIDRLENKDKYPSYDQMDIALLEIDGKPRLVRGVAGSGKTVIMSHMVANNLVRGRQAELDFSGNEVADSGVNIVVVCFNRCLVPFIEESIRLSYKEKTGRDLEPDKKISIMHFHGYVKSHLVRTGLISKKSWDDTWEKMSTLTNEERSRLYCDEIFSKDSALIEKHKADMIFVDEGQDLEHEDYRLLFGMCRQQNLIVFYDDAQNIYGRGKPEWSKLGISIVGRSRVMKETYRNTRQITALAYNVLMCVKGPEKLGTGMKGFADYKYLSETGLVEAKGEFLKVNFGVQGSDFKPKVMKFNSSQDEIKWVAEEICRLVTAEKVRPEDILVLFSYRYVKKKDKTAFSEALINGIEGRVKGIPGITGINRAHAPENKDKHIFKRGYITCSTVASAKGYDAPVVFFVSLNNVDHNTEQGRAVFYIGATRAKHMLYITGSADQETDFMDEILATQEALN